MSATRPEWFELLLGYDCNAVCSFCSQELSWRRRKAATREQALAALSRARAVGFERVGFLGGEVTLRPDLEFLTRAARRLGFRRVRVLTNGILLGDEALCRSLFDAGLDTVHFSVHGDTAALHDRLVEVPGAFVRLERSLRAFRRLGADVGVKILLNKANAPRLPAMMRLFLEDWGVSDLAITLPLRTGEYLRHAEALDLRYAETVPALAAAFAAWRESPAPKARPPDIRNLPPCLMPDAAGQNADLLPETDSVERPAEAARGAAPKRKVAACASCAWEVRCAGVDEGYLRRYGDGEIVPVPASDPLAEVNARLRDRDLDGALRALAAAVGAAWRGPAPQLRVLGERQDLQGGWAPDAADSRRARSALLLLERARRVFPRRGEVRLLKGAALLSILRARAARVELDEAVLMSPALALAWRWRFSARSIELAASNERSMQKLAEMKEDLDRALALDPLDAQTWALRGDLLHDLEQGTAALADLDRALELDPRHTRARLERADLLSELGRWRESMEDFAVLMRRSPAAWLYAMRGRAHAKCGRSAAALADLGRALRRDRRLGAVYAWRGELLRKAGRAKEASADLDEAVRRSPRDANARLWRAGLALAQARWSDALRDADAARRIERFQLNAHTARGQALWMLGRTRAAVSAFDAAYPLNPRSAWTPPPGVSRAQSYADALDARIAQRPGDAWAWAFRGRARVEDPAPGSLDAGLRDLDAALALDARLGWAWAWKGECLRRMGRAQAGREALEKAVALSPDSAWARAWLGRAKEDASLRAEALADYRAASRLDPSAGWILAQAGRLSGAAEDLERAALLDVKA